MALHNISLFQLGPKNKLKYLGFCTNCNQWGAQKDKFQLIPTQPDKKAGRSYGQRSLVDLQKRPPLNWLL